MILATSCTVTPIKRIEKYSNKKTSSTFVLDDPERIKTQLFGNTLIKKTESLGLPTLRNGTHEFELRIWDDFNFLRGRLFVLKYENSKWSANKCNYKYEVTEDLLPDSLSGNILTLSEPKGGWNVFVEKLLDLNILDLRDYESISGYELSSDELPIIVEYATKNYYRLFELPGANRRVDKIPEAKKIVEILSYIYTIYPK